MKRSKPLKRTRLRKRTKNKAIVLKKKCVILAKLIARKRDGDKCQYCGVSSRTNAIHGSHILPEGAYPLMSTEPYNIIPLCAVHHLSGANPRMGNREPSWHGDPIFFAKWFEKKWPGRYQKLLDMNKEKGQSIFRADEHYWSEKLKELEKYD